MDTNVIVNRIKGIRYDMSLIIGFPVVRKSFSQIRAVYVLGTWTDKSEICGIDLYLEI